MHGFKLALVLLPVAAATAAVQANAEAILSAVDQPAKQRLWTEAHPQWTVAHDVALGAMLRAQAADGSFAATPKADPDPQADVAATALAVLALLDSGSTLRVGPHRTAIKSAIAWLRNRQEANGTMCNRGAPDGDLAQALATAAMVRAFRRSNYALLRKNAILGLGAALAPTAREVDPLALAVTLWGLEDLATGGPADFVDAGNLLRAGITPLVGGRGLVVWRGSGAPFEGPGPDPAETVTAALLAIHATRPFDGEIGARLQLARPWLDAGRRRWVEGGAMDGMTLIFGAEAAFAAGGDMWRGWAEAIETQLLPLVTVRGDQAGAVRLPCGHALLLRPTSAQALVALALAVPVR